MWMVHLFLHCEIVAKVSQLVMKWIEVNFLIPHNLLAHLDCCTHEATFKKFKHVCELFGMQIFGQFGRCEMV